MEPSELLSDIGEYALHGRIADLLNKASSQRVVGDDSSVIDLASFQGQSLLVSTDRLASGVEEGIRARLLVVQTLSDVVAMGGTPIGILIAMQLPRTATSQEAMVFLEAAEAEAAKYGCHLIGGDTKEGSEFSAVGVGLGVAPSETVVRRVPLEAGQVVGVTLRQGKKWGLRWGHHLVKTYNLDIDERLRSHLEAADEDLGFPFSESLALARSGHVTAGLDMSDGLGASLNILARANNTSISVVPEALDSIVDASVAPVADALNISIRSFALSPGYMWNNVYALDAGDVDAARSTVQAVGGDFVVVGQVVTAAQPSVTYEMRACPALTAASDEKFRSWAWSDRTDHWLDAVRRSQL